MVLADRGPWYLWALERSGLRHERFSIRSRVERLFRYLKERVAVSYHKMSASTAWEGYSTLKCSLGPFSIHYRTIRR